MLFRFQLFNNKTNEPLYTSDNMENCHIKAVKLIKSGCNPDDLSLREANTALDVKFYLQSGLLFWLTYQIETTLETKHIKCYVQNVLNIFAPIHYEYIDKVSNEQRGTNDYTHYDMVIIEYEHVIYFFIGESP